MTWLRGIALGLLLASRVTMANFDGEEVAQQLQDWLEVPLDLRRATLAELELLPWLDLDDAQRVVGLREAGGLQRFSDLSSAGLDAATISAIEPFVSLSPRPAWSWSARNVRRYRGRRPDDRWDALATMDAWTLRTQASTQTQPVGLLSFRQTVFVGDFRPRMGWGIFLADPGRRSRSAPVSMTGRWDVAAASVSRPGWRGGAFRAAAAGWGLLAAWEVTGGRLVALETRWGSVASGLAWRAARDEAVAAWSGGGRERLTWRLYWQPRRGQGSVAAAAVRAGVGRHRGGLAWVEAPVGGAAGHDPLTGQTLDRPHRAWQSWVRTRHDRLSAQLLVRHRIREGDRSLRHQISIGMPVAPGRLGVRARLDQSPSRALRTQLAWDWTGQPRPDVRWNVWFRQDLSGSQRDDIAGFSGRWSSGAWDVGGGLAFAGGDGSSYWVLGLPQGVEGRWLGPGANGVAIGISHASRYGTWAASALWDLDPADRPHHQVVLRWRSRTPLLVRSLH